MRYIGPCGQAVAFLLKWRNVSRYKTQEQAEAYIKKFGRSTASFMREKYEFRIVDTRSIDPTPAQE